MTEKMTEKKYFDVRRNHLAVCYVRRDDRGIGFCLRGDGLFLADLRIASTKDGREFVAAPSYRNSRGKYHSFYSLYLDPEVEASLIARVKAEAGTADDVNNDGVW